MLPSAISNKSSGILVQAPFLCIKSSFIGDDSFIAVEEMEAPMKYICIMAFLLAAGIAGLEKADGAGECAKSTPDREAWKLAPCATAAQDGNAAVSSSCCVQVKKIGQSPACLCAVLLSNTAKSAGIDPAIAVTIPKRCNLVDRPVGYKCGAYTLP